LPPKPLVHSVSVASDVSDASDASDGR
jgi:hypothetical protein